MSLLLPPVPYLLYVYIRCGWGLLNRVDLWLLARSSLGSWSTSSPPYSLSGPPQTHTHQHHHCQHATPYSSHPSTNNSTLKISLLVFPSVLTCPFLTLTLLPRFVLKFSVPSHCLLSDIPCLLHSNSNSQTQTQNKCINSKIVGDKHVTTEDDLVS